MRQITEQDIEDKLCALFDVTDSDDIVGQLIIDFVHDNIASAVSYCNCTLARAERSNA